MDKEERAFQQSQRELFSLITDYFQKFSEGVMDPNRDLPPNLADDLRELQRLLELYSSGQEEIQRSAGLKHEQVRSLVDNPDQLQLDPKQKKLWDRIEGLKQEIADHKLWYEKQGELDTKKSPPKKKKKRRGLGGKKDDWMQL